MTLRRYISFWTLGASVALPAMAATERHVVTTEQIAAAVSSAGMQVSPEQVSLLATVVASTPDPQLKVRSIEPSGQQRAIARLECADREQCLPFFVAIRLNGQHDAGSSNTDKPAAPTVIPAKMQAAAPVVRRGASAMLLLDGDHVQIKIPVTCLENGTTGQTIQAADKDHHQVYTAQVVSENLLRGRF